MRVIDDRTLLLPDRVGNNRLDAMTNLLVNPRIGMLFLVPGMNETLRINGTARITDDARLLAPCAVERRPPKIGLVIAIEEAFLHCGKALVRSKLWDASRQIDRASLPSYAEMLLDHVGGLTHRGERAPVPDHGRARALLNDASKSKLDCHTGACPRYPLNRGRRSKRDAGSR